jgi:diaminohydroxyphosphoribosylaminopyrimidine deaminase/5-amino-6-(5-phosphoribosylamino)uracil reductase
VLVEGGGTLAAGLIGAGLVDRVAWFHAPLLIGGDGRPAIGSLGVDRLREARLLRLHATEAFDGDRLGHYGPADR